MCKMWRREREAMTHVRRISVVYANWCPHCVPTTVEPMKQCAAELGAELDLVDIDAEEGRGDRLVREYGDWAEDYIIPQVFFGLDDGRTVHVMTGFSEGVPLTRAAVERLRRSRFYSELMRR